MMAPTWLTCDCQVPPRSRAADSLGRVRSTLSATVLVARLRCGCHNDKLRWQRATAVCGCHGPPSNEGQADPDLDLTMRPAPVSVTGTTSLVTSCHCPHAVHLPLY